MHSTAPLDALLRFLTLLATPRKKNTHVPLFFSSFVGRALLLGKGDFPQIHPLQALSVKVKESPTRQRALFSSVCDGPSTHQNRTIGNNREPIFHGNRNKKNQFSGWLRPPWLDFRENVGLFLLAFFLRSSTGPFLLALTTTSVFTSQTPTLTRTHTPTALRSQQAPAKPVVGIFKSKQAAGKDRTL